MELLFFFLFSLRMSRLMLDLDEPNLSIEFGFLLAAIVQINFIITHASPIQV